MAVKFLQLFGWSLGDVPLSISIDGDISLAIHRLNEKIQPMGPVKLQMPMYLSERNRCAGYMKNDDIYLIAPSKWYGLSSVFSLDRIVFFKGKFSYDQKKLNGQFQFLNIHRMPNIAFYAVLSIFAVIVFSFALWNMFYLWDIFSSAKFFIAFVFVGLFFSFILLFIQLEVFLTTHSRNEVKNFLIEVLNSEDCIPNYTKP